MHNMCEKLKKIHAKEIKKILDN